MILYGAEAPPRHGGDLSVARRLFPDAREPFIDLSTGINPNPYKLPRLPAGLFSRLPDGEATEALAAAAARAYGAPSAACIVAAPGSQILLPLAAALARPGLAAILTPSYGEFAPAAQMAGHAVRPIEGLGECGEAALAIIGNPNNPDGRVFAGDALIALADRLGARGGLLVVDEAFMDVGAPGASLAGAVLRGNIVVLRSFGKFFGLAGLRLGFALATPALATRLAAALGPWAVSGPAQVIGAQALADIDWIERTRRRLANAAKRLDAVLSRAGLDILGGTSLFRLARTPAADALYRHLGRAGIFVRTFPDRPAWLRFGLPPDGTAWDRLEAALASFRPAVRPG